MTESTNENMDAIKKTSRAKSSRAQSARRRPWAPPSKLDAPPAPPGFRHRWIRAETRGVEDTSNITGRLREGYELVRKDEYPDFESPVMGSGKYEGVFGVGGLLLARIPVETVAERTAYFDKRSADLQQAVDHDLMRENAHSTMVIGKPERQSRVTFGSRQGSES